MKQYLNIIQQHIPSVSENDLNLPIREANIDSIDNVVIRVALEKYFGFVVEDSIWYRFQSLSEALEYFHKNKKSDTSCNIKLHSIFKKENVEVRMPQMANQALSENWLLRHLGDTHWVLLSEGFDQKSSEFKDQYGNRLYATFVRISYTLSPLNLFRENEVIDFSSTIDGFGSNTFISHITGKSGYNKIKANLMTTFSCRENNNNSELVKGRPATKVYSILEVNNTPAFLNDYRLVKKGLLDELYTAYGTFTLKENILWSYVYEINPYYEINGVGLLYFASYPIIADKCLSEYYRVNTLNKDFANSFHTVFRDIFYMANCNPGDKVIFHLNYLVESKDELRIINSLARESDSTTIAKIITVKKKA